MRIYVACLASYNNGVLHGRWIEASADVEAMQEEVNAILRESKFPNVTVECPECAGTGRAEIRNVETKTTEEGPCQCCRNGRIPSAEEWAIHDFDGLPTSLGEYCGLQAVADAVEFIEEAEDDHGMDEEDAKALLEDCGGSVTCAKERLENYCGKFDSFRDYADDYADEMLACEMQEMDKRTRDNSLAFRYFDYASFARDLAMDMHTVEVSDGVLVFHA